MRELLYKIKEMDKLISVFFDKNHPDTFLTGYVNGIDDEFVIINHITPQGFYDGYICIRIDDIICVEYDGKYEDKICSLYQAKNSNKHIYHSEEVPVKESLIKWAHSNKILVSVGVFDTSILGIVTQMGALWEIRRIDEYGEEEGISVIYEDDIEWLAVDSEEEQSARLLLAGNGKRKGR